MAAQAGDGAIDLPVQVLVTTGTSGAAEIFAAALDGNKRADLVGEHTLGRAGIQKLVKLPENRGLWLTYARYLTPSGEAIHGKGLKPDVEVEDLDVDGVRRRSDLGRRIRFSTQRSRASRRKPRSSLQNFLTPPDRSRITPAH